MIQVDTTMNATPSANNSDNLGQGIQDWKKKRGWGPLSALVCV